MLNDARTRLKDLLVTLGAPPKNTNELTLIMYFDEAHVLTPEPGNNSKRRAEKTNLDWLMSALDEFRSYGLFAIFLSTQSSLQSLAPSVLWANSPRYIAALPKLHAPITETPFDCMPMIIPSSLTYDDICAPLYMSQFGRPLCVSHRRRHHVLTLPFSKQMEYHGPGFRGGTSGR